LVVLSIVIFICDSFGEGAGSTGDVQCLLCFSDWLDTVKCQTHSPHHPV
jgi:hypothetical protein